MKPQQPSGRARSRRRAGAFAWGGGLAALVLGGLLAGPSRADAEVVEATPDRRPVAPISWTDSSCNGCHRVDETFSHPVGMRPGMPIPEGFPLENGRMTCLTCHDGSDSRRHAEARSGSGAMLRPGISGLSLCAQCHEPSIGSSSDAHSLAAGRAHLRWPDERPDRHVAAFASGLDAESGTCMECHDGSLASAVGSHSGGSLVVSMMGQDHPIGVPYRATERIARFGSGRVVHAGSLDWRIRLFDGTVGCGSCHSVYSDEPSHLVMSNLGSALCLSCHEDG